MHPSALVIQQLNTSAINFFFAVKHDREAVRWLGLFA